MKIKKVKVTATQYDNLKTALYEMWPSVPEKNVYPGLEFWTSEENRQPDCKTLACFGGWCAVWPTFVNQGVLLAPTGAPLMGYLWGSDVSKKLFGHTRLFDTMGYPETGNPHSVVLKRLQVALENSVIDDTIKL